MTEFEVIMINDGSTDSSASICDKYAATDSRFRVIHKSNAGVSAARQDGLGKAIGEYVIHADSDDWVEPTMAEELYNKARKEDADVVICDYFNNYGSTQIVCSQQPSSLKPSQVLIELFQQLHGSCCNKLARRACYNKYGIRFPEGINYCEDQLTWVQLFSHDEIKIAYLNKAFYHYCDNPNSITRNYQRPQYQARRNFAQKLALILPSKLKREIISKVNLRIFTEAFIFDVLSTDEIKQGIRLNWEQVSHCHSVKWRIGYILIYCGFYRLAHKLIHY